MQSARRPPVSIASARPSYLVRRNALVEQHLPLVRTIAAGIKLTLPPSFDLSDLVATGNLALVKAADRYRPKEHGGTPFECFARQIVRGAILDSARRRHYAENTRPNLDAVPEPIAIRASVESIERQIDSKRMAVRLADAVAYLPEDEAQLLRLYYGADEPKLRELAPRLALTMPQARTRRLRAIGRLRARLGGGPLDRMAA